MQPIVVENDQSQVKKPHLDTPQKSVFEVDIFDYVFFICFKLCAGVNNIENDHDHQKNQKAKE